MLPTILVTFATVLLELCTTSPVYNMQPAFITANIGTVGRNIRNLPCISRKTNQSGVCMFAIDCLKANGTHLGTCIDRFYFGSCCHIEPVNDIIDNTIDDIIPAREPPQRLSSTIKPIPTTTKTEKPPPTKTTTTTPATTTTRKVFITNITTTTTTIKPTTTTEKSVPLKQGESTTVGYKLTTFQSVDINIPVETTSPKTTPKSKPTKVTPKPTKTTPKPVRTTISTKKPTSKPVLNTTKKPVLTTVTTRQTSTTVTTTTRRPSTTAVRRPSTTTTRKPPTLSTRRPSTTTTRKPTTTTKPTKPSTTTTKRPVDTKPTTRPVKITSTTTTRKPSTTTVTKKPSTTTTTKKPSTATTTTPKPTTLVTRNVTQASESNEIETESSSSVKPPSTTAGSIVTWTIGNTEKNVSAPTTSSPGNSTSEEWLPLTTPDQWVPLPSVQASTQTASPSTTAKPSTTESASKPSITYIPLESTTSSVTLNASTVVTEGVVTSQATPASFTPPSTTVGSDTEIRPVNMSDFTDVCGRRMYPEGRIVGGEKSSFGKWPWQISLRQWRTSTYLHKCGAALLNENWAITAAHCVDNVPPSDLLLRLGEHDLSTESEPYLHQERRVQIVASHPQFDPRTFEYDLALLRFYEPVTFQPNILPVCVPQSDENFVGRTAYVTGWGRLYEDGPLPSVLQEVSVPVINNSVCESMYRSAGYIEHIPHIFICAGWRRGGFDSCEGDSGGPMVIQREDKRFLLAGIISWGIGCAEPNQPGVYTRISEFRDWINQILQF
ncbi:hypothetical protein TcasGA2_TC033855 [Tribolium castaneum]|uniref:Peptidase S1 domain-containing protein n=3 Tax=Tribolium castaneum TaxID=7070 RepID=A0A139WFG0_TRICA|nr:hypothetical protein TcasGA2_TC033855 [Tribolium castaneum]